MKTMNFVKGHINPLLVMGVTFLFMLFVGFLVFNGFAESDDVMYSLCCDGKPCSDTYYDRALNKCVLTMCTQLPGIDVYDCMYEPANITMVGVSG